MLHVLTVHWQSAQWIDVQLRHLRRHLSAPVRLYAFLDGIAGDRGDEFDYVASDPAASHAVKLNRLAEVACARAERDDDVLLFIDGDAFPIADLGEYLDRRLASHPLVAVQRRENMGDCQPHPCFAATTVGLWQRIGGDWREGFVWETDDGRRKTDVGGNLLRILREHRVDWFPMRRSNRKNPHPLLFAIYDDVVYHHGAGFRAGVSSVDQARAGLRGVRPGILTHPLFAFHPKQRRYRRLQAENERLKQEMFDAIRAGDAFLARLR